MPASTLNTIIDAIKSQAERYRVNGIDPNCDARMEVCLERFAQAIHMGTETRIFTGSIPQLLHRLKALPSNALMTMVVGKLKLAHL